MALTQKEISARIYKKRKENGLCPSCGKVLDRKGHYCSECLEKHNEYKKDNRDFWRKNHICTVCGKFIVPSNEKICPECRVRQNNIRKPLSEERKKLYNYRFRKQQNAIYKERSKNGICTRCGKHKALEGKRKCGICLEKDAMQHRKKRMDQMNIREFRKENHLCYFCGHEIDLVSGNICNQCAEKFKNNGKKNGRKNEYWNQQNKLLFGGKKYE